MLFMTRSREEGINFATWSQSLSGKDLTTDEAFVFAYSLVCMSHTRVFWV
ncbi:hypothetical protein RE6C_01023 [Rhodopirellula europaea 6C]|uniref:Uncharacterized protein n=1 Tax=Rhodopirellula europaea 6C TaxID=1263867 RepID=M2A8L0_9BACT|nr:hypothetical protein RE6C_01023 [Rhodopirellula europaea 6C]